MKKETRKLRARANNLTPPLPCEIANIHNANNNYETGNAEKLQRHQLVVAQTTNVSI